MNRQDSMNKDSPEFVRMSLAAAITLGFLPGRFYRNARLYCINLLLSYSNGCLANCAYCGLARGRRGSYQEKSFIRVEWPVYQLGEVIGRIKARQERVKRICLSMITNRRAPEDVMAIVTRILSRLQIPLSLLATPTVLEEGHLWEFKRKGVERLGVAIDAATEGVFCRYRGGNVGGPHDWYQYWEFLKTALRVFGKGRVGVHLIVGLGETEQEMVKTIQGVQDLGGITHLFSFFPEKGSRLEKRPQPPVGQYRRIQLARFLIDSGLTRYQKMEFNPQGQILSYGLSGEELDRFIEIGTPFMTSGCPDRDGNVACNRPYGDSPPGPDIRSYPFRPNKIDLRSIRRQLRDYS